ncbi:MAG: coenzyme F420-0:L-glutamate ligase [Acidobacteriota bacterium]
MCELAITGIPMQGEVQPGDSLGALITEGLESTGRQWQDGDILIVAQKVVSKAEGRIVRLDQIKPSRLARQWAQRFSKDPRLLEVVLQQAHRIVRMSRGIVIAETQHGFVCANCGVDQSNTEPGTAVLLPKDPDESARKMRDFILDRHGKEIACIVSDSFGRPWREGLVSVALGVAGLQPLLDLRGQPDRQGRKLAASLLAVGDELAAAAGLAMGKAQGVPAVLIRGYRFSPAQGSGKTLLRPPGNDLFR